MYNYFFPVKFPICTILVRYCTVITMKQFRLLFIYFEPYNHFEHFFSNCFNKKKNTLNFYDLWSCEVPHNLKESDIHYSVMILKSVSPGYHFNQNTLLRKSYFIVFAYWTSTIKWASSSNCVERCINSSVITSAWGCLSIFCIFDVKSPLYN